MINVIIITDSDAKERERENIITYTQNDPLTKKTINIITEYIYIYVYIIIIFVSLIHIDKH